MKTWENFKKDYKVISFDFDGTLTTQGYHSPYSSMSSLDPHLENVEKLKQFKKDGCIVYIVTRRLRTPDSTEEITKFIRLNKLKVDGLFFTNHMDKVHKLVKLKVELHHDDDPQEIDAIKEIAPQIATVQVE